MYHRHHHYHHHHQDNSQVSVQNVYIFYIIYFTFRHSCWVDQQKRQVHAEAQVPGGGEKPPHYRPQTDGVFI